MCSLQLAQIFWRATAEAAPTPCWGKQQTKKFKIGSKVFGCFSIHSQSSPNSRTDVYFTATWVFSGTFNIASTTFGTTSFSDLQIYITNLYHRSIFFFLVTYGKTFFATACIINRAASLESHVTPGACKLINICLKQLLLPTINTTSFIKSDTCKE